MSIRWSDALLAGAAGVADYNLNEQKKRQERIDRAASLKEQMSLYQAKSDFAYRQKAFDETEGLYKALGATRADSPLGQYILQSKMEPKLKSSEVLARIKLGQKVTLPERLNAPQFNVPDIDNRVATSPAQDWIRKFKGQDMQLPEVEGGEVQAFMQAEQAKAQERELLQSQKRLQAKQAGDQALTMGDAKGIALASGGSAAANIIPQAPETTITPEASRDKIREATRNEVLDALSTKEGQKLSFHTYKKVAGGEESFEIVAMDKETGEVVKTVSNPTGIAADLSKNDKKLSFHTFKKVEGGEESFEIVAVDKATGEVVKTISNPTGIAPDLSKNEKKLTFHTFKKTVGGEESFEIVALDKVTGEVVKTISNPTGMSTIVRAPDLITEERDGSKTIKQRGWDAAAGKPVFFGGVFTAANPQEPSAKVKWTATGTIKQFMSAENDNGTIGGFHTTFPDEELKRVESGLDDQEGKLWSMAIGVGDEQLAKYKTMLATNYLNLRQSSTLLTNRHMQDPDAVALAEQLWKAQSYLQTFGKEKLTDLLRKGAVPPAIFKGGIVEDEEIFKKILEDAGQTTSPLSFNRPQEVGGYLREVGTQDNNTFENLRLSNEFKF